MVAWTVTVCACAGPVFVSSIVSSLHPQQTWLVADRFRMRIGQPPLDIVRIVVLEC